MYYCIISVLPLFLSSNRNSFEFNKKGNIFEEHRSILRNLRTGMLLEAFSWLLCILVSALLIHYLPLTQKSSLLHTTWMKMWPQTTTSLYVTGPAILRKTKSIWILSHLPTPFTIPDFQDQQMFTSPWHSQRGPGVMFDECGCQESPYSHVNDGKEKKN